MVTSRSVDRLAAGALDWLVTRLDHFDPFSDRAASAAHPPAKAALELALLCHCVARLDGATAELGAAPDLVRRLWAADGFSRLLADRPATASSYALIFAALAPRPVDAGRRRAALAGVAPGFLTPAGKTPYQRIEIRYYADKAGAPHGIEPLKELVPHSPPVTLRAATEPGAPPLTTGDAYRLTHATFYLGDFGHADPGLPAQDTARARELVAALLRHCVAHDLWDLAAELLLTQFVLGADPLRDAAGAAAVDCLTRAAEPDGSLPGRSPELAAVAGDSAAETFAKAYHTTLVTALMALTLSAASPR
ncbi:DUF6895 family protein [Streptomyces profundus]|uniref:DUF6895 family protein n=1 Tax=Streptomyces profundus TaxID=2867410 RepID=UPI001D1659F7|nr:hypothetical protein [Streptomyces sp. MA3_2.13]UED85108.1 hypothetical protein K4G22_13625 [Streptomyces sp. MA3_2.13]